MVEQATGSNSHSPLVVIHTHTLVLSRWRGSVLWVWAVWLRAWPCNLSWLLGRQWTWHKQTFQMPVSSSFHFLALLGSHEKNMPCVSTGSKWTTDAWNKPEPTPWSGIQPSLARFCPKLWSLGKKWMLITVSHYGVCGWLLCSNSYLQHLPLRDSHAYHFGLL